MLRNKRGCYSYKVREGYDVELWKAIRKFWHLISIRLPYVMGIGQRVKI